MLDCEKQLQVLAKAELEAKDALVEVIELKNDCQELVDNVSEAEYATSKRENSFSNTSGDRNCLDFTLIFKHLNITTQLE